MTYLPAQTAWNPTIIGPANLFNSELHSMCGATNPGSAAWPSANRALYTPIYINEPVIVKQMSACSGSTANGTLDMAVYNEWFAQVIASPSGAITQTGTDVPQVFNITDIALMPGRYYIGLVHSNALGTYRRWTNSNSAPHPQKYIGLAQEALGSTAMPTTMTPVANADLYIPQVGLHIESVTW